MKLNIFIILLCIYSGISSAGSLLVCDGTVSISQQGEPTCSSDFRLVDSTVSETPKFTASSIDPALAANYFSGGFAIFLIPWAVAFGAAQILNFIKN